MEAGETIEECLERELFEELGIRTRAAGVIAVTDIPGKGNDYHLMALRTEILGGKLDLSVHDSFEWVKKEDFSRYKMAPADEAIITKTNF